MKKQILFLTFLIAFATTTAVAASATVKATVIASEQVKSVKPDTTWTANRFSMFIHWGLYSQLGGVWNGKPVEWGYSEQIQSFAGIFGDYYAATAKDFTAQKWNADSIAALAKAAQMQSIVMTAKHHDGFSMYATKHSKYNVVEATPFGRDPLMELSKACKKAGLRFGIYFSLIDWNFPQAYPISSHNADPITPEHHKHNMNQVRELLTNYGPVSEIWFDMGSLTREQSSELYNLVTTLQPSCMVSGRLGNDFGDFAVMADNACPDYRIGIPWQSAGSVYKETWSYRSWQKRDDLNGKIGEKIATLRNIVNHGGNYLLNLGPRGDGSVVEFERDLLLAMGQRLRDSSAILHGYNINGGSADNNISSNSSSKRSNINNDGNGSSKRNNISNNSGSNSNNRPPLITSGTLNFENASPIYGYSCFDYYSSSRSIIGYEWNFTGQKNTPYIVYHAGDYGKELLFTLNGTTHPVKLNGTATQLSQTNHPTIKYSFLLSNGRSSFAEQFIDPKATEALQSLYTKTDLAMAEKAGWKITGTAFTYKGAKWKSNLWIAHIIESDCTENILAEFTNGNGGGCADAIEIWLNGKQLLKMAYTNVKPVAEYVNLPLQKGSNTLLVKLHNRFEEQINYSFTTNIPQQYYKQYLPFKIPGKAKKYNLKITSPTQKGGKDIGLRDLTIKLN